MLMGMTKAKMRKASCWKRHVGGETAKAEQQSREGAGQQRQGSKGRAAKASELWHKWWDGQRRASEAEPQRGSSRDRAAKTKWQSRR